MTEYYTLGSWDRNGVPLYLDSVINVPPNLVDRIISTLPERSNLITANPNYLNESIPRNLIIRSNDEAFDGVDVYVTFLYEAAGYKNTVGYYHYPLNGEYTVPTKYDGSNWVPLTYEDRNNVDDNSKSILHKTVIFPNASLPTWDNRDGKNYMSGGGNLRSGSRVRLVYNMVLDFF